MDKKTLIDNLNSDLANELSAIIQYITYAAKATGPYRPQLAAFFLEEVADEQLHAQFLANKIVALGGEPTTVAAPVPPAATNREMLEKVLAAELQAEFLPLDERPANRYDILINTTPVGMHPNTDATPIAKQALSKDMVVMDFVYNPLKTRFLRDAVDKGCLTVNGLDMFVLQGAHQFELWTGKKAPLEVMRAAVLKALQRDL